MRWQIVVSLSDEWLINKESADEIRRLGHGNDGIITRGWPQDH